MSENTSSKRTLIGRVVSDRMERTVTVLVERRVKHAMYDKIIVRSSKYHAQNDNNEAKLGDMVEIQESRPLSKTKSWVVSRLLERAVATALKHDRRSPVVARLGGHRKKNFRKGGLDNFRGLWQNRLRLADLRFWRRLCDGCDEAERLGALRPGVQCARGCRHLRDGGVAARVGAP
jgi:small subunit ribosomal protein S17